MGSSKNPKEKGGQAGHQSTECGNIDSPDPVASQANEWSPDAL
jgi:hypothetical protein